MPIIPVVTFEDLTDHQLVNLSLALQLACGKSHQGLRRPRKQWYCFMFQVLDLERQARGLPSPPAQSHAGDLSPNIA